VIVHNVGRLTGNLHGFASNYTIDGGTFVNNGYSTGGLDGQKEFINADVVGSGTFGVSSYHGSGGTLEFGKSVNGGQSIIIGGGSLGPSFLEIDQPTKFKASVAMDYPGSAIDLNKLAADSYSSHNGVLDFFSGNRVVDTLRFNPGSVPFGVAQGTSHGGAGIEIYSIGTQHEQPSHGLDLPLHV
jgi:hypothetical protein